MYASSSLTSAKEGSSVMKGTERRRGSSLWNRGRSGPTRLFLHAHGKRREVDGAESAEAEDATGLMPVDHAPEGLGHGEEDEAARLDLHAHQDIAKVDMHRLTMLRPLPTPQR